MYLTNRVEVRGAENLINVSGRPALIISWHGRSLFAGPVIKRTVKNCTIIVSRHQDGQVAAKYLRLYGFRVVIGSSGQDGAGALMAGARVLKQNIPLCLTPDGPRGPRMQMNDGVGYFAKISGAPVVTFCYSCSRPFIFKSWDRHMIPKPFGKVIIDVTAPIYYDKTNPNEMDDFRAKIETRLNDQLHGLDEEFGLPRLEPAEKKK
jgi:hypothetical protein